VSEFFIRVLLRVRLLSCWQPPHSQQPHMMRGTHRFTSLPVKASFFPPHEQENDAKFYKKSELGTMCSHILQLVNSEIEDEYKSCSFCHSVHDAQPVCMILFLLFPNTVGCISN
jgi:hypothetical protein